MNELSELFLNVPDGAVVKLEKNRVYAAAPEDSFHLKGFFFSNTAKQAENPEGERFCPIYLEGKKNITIDGNGATLMLHGIMTPFLFHNCENITLKNLAIDHFRPTMSEMTVVNSAPGRAMVRINPEFRYRIENNVLYWQGEPDLNGEPYWEIPYKAPFVLTHAFDPAAGMINEIIPSKGELWGVPDIAAIEPADDGLLTLLFRNTERLIPQGTVLQTRCIRRVQTGGAIDGCKNVTLDSLRVYSMNCFGILGQNSENLTYTNLNLTPKAGRTVVSDADFFHFSGCSGTVKVIGCKAAGAHDDIINIHGTHLKITAVLPETCQVCLRYSHPESWGFQPYAPGDEIEYVNGNTLLPYGSARVQAIEKRSPTDYCIAVDRLPPHAPAENDVVENITRTASLLAEHNVFERIPSRAILCTTRKDTFIRNNVFKNMGAAALCVADDANFWFESGRTGTIVFENNTVINCAGWPDNFGTDVIRYEPVVLDSASAAPVHQMLICRNNRFLNTRGIPYTFKLDHLAEAVFQGNDSNLPLGPVTK